MTLLSFERVEGLNISCHKSLIFQEVRSSKPDVNFLSPYLCIEATSSGNGRPVISAAGLELLQRDKRTEAIRLLNQQRSRFGYTNIAVILWVNRATLAEISTWAADFYSWRSATLFIEPPPGWSTLESMRRSYLQALVAHNELINLQGLAPIRGGRIVQMRMEDIFIPLRAEQETKPSDRLLFPDRGVLVMAGIPGEIEDVQHLAVREKIQAQKLRSVDLEKLSPEMRRAWEHGVFRAEREVKPRPVEISELLQERRAVVLGDPGAGKTTLLRYVTYTLSQLQLAHRPSEVIHRAPDLADCLPVYVRIGEYAQYLERNPRVTLDAFAPISCQARQLPLMDDLLKDTMLQGRALFLLDGLDEVIDTGQRHEVAQSISQFALSQPQCRIIVTSRIVGYREAQFGREFSQFTISLFEDNEIRRFAENWYKALGMPESAKSLVESVREPSIRRLASNPLLLTVIALIHWRGTRLPHHRITLYRLAAETLVDQWMSYRRVSPEGWDVQETYLLNNSG